jgi:hypothetical protein
LNPTPNWKRHSIAMLAACTLGGCMTQRGIPAAGTVVETRVVTTVDTQLAKSYLETSFAQGPRHDQTKAVRALCAKFDQRTMSWELLRDLTHETSVDFATLYFIRRTLMDQRNVQWQSRFAALVRELRARSTLSIRKDLEKRMELSLYRFLFVPGFHYRTDPSSGADLAGPRTYLRNCGFDTQLVEVEEDGTIEQNAAFIAAAVRKETSAGKRLIIVSTSIGGPETAMALGKLVSVDDLRPVAAWISVGGLLGGTVLADQAERWPMSWLAKLAFLFKGIDARAIPGMTTVSSRRRMTELRFLKSLLVLDYIGAPLSGQIAADVKGRWKTLARFGPNDGLTLLGDEVLNSGRVVFAIGQDHYYRDPEIDLKALALACLVLEQLSKTTFNRPESQFKKIG